MSFRQCSHHHQATPGLIRFFHRRFGIDPWPTFRASLTGFSNTSTAHIHILPMTFCRCIHIQVFPVTWRTHPAYIRSTFPPLFICHQIHQIMCRIRSSAGNPPCLCSIVNAGSASDATTQMVLPPWSLPTGGWFKKNQSVKKWVGELLLLTNEMMVGVFSSHRTLRTNESRPRWLKSRLSLYTRLVHLPSFLWLFFVEKPQMWKQGIDNMWHICPSPPLFITVNYIKTRNTWKWSIDEILEGVDGKGWSCELNVILSTTSLSMSTPSWVGEGKAFLCCYCHRFELVRKWMNCILSMYILVYVAF